MNIKDRQRLNDLENQIQSLTKRLDALEGQSTYNPELLTRPELQSLLKLSQSKCLQLLREGKIPGAAKIGDQWRIDKAILQRHFKV